MNAETLIGTLQEGKPVFGVQLISTSPMLLPFVDKIGPDFIFLDLEHIPMDREIVSWMCRAFSAKGIMPFVRVPEPNPSLICQQLDAGAEGIIVPYIEDAARVSSLVGAVRYRPLKGAYLKEKLKGNYEFNKATKEFLKGDVWNANPKDKMLLINIESVPGMEHLEEILKVPGIDGVMIGPQDLSVSLGIPEQYESEAYDRAVGEIARKVTERGLYCGIHFAVTPKQGIHFMKDYGIRILLEANEMVAFTRDVGERLREMREEADRL